MERERVAALLAALEALAAHKAGASPLTKMLMAPLMGLVRGQMAKLTAPQLHGYLASLSQTLMDCCDEELDDERFATRVSDRITALSRADD